MRPILDAAPTADWRCHEPHIRIPITHCRVRDRPRRWPVVKRQPDRTGLKVIVHPRLMFGQKKKARSPRPWYATGLNFTCTQCGNCCSGTEGEIPVTHQDIRRIAGFLGVSTASFKKLYTSAADTHRLRRLKMRPHPSSEGEEDCIFLDRSSGRALCLVHEVKPSQCRAWPFWPDSLKSREAWEAAGKHCCGIDRGPDLVPLEEISSHRGAMEALEHTYGKFEQGWD